MGLEDQGQRLGRRQGSATTGGRSGSFEVERQVGDLAGTDTVSFRARHAGQTCKGTIAF